MSEIKKYSKYTKNVNDVSKIPEDKTEKESSIINAEADEKSNAITPEEPNSEKNFDINNNTNIPDEIIEKYLKMLGENDFIIENNKLCRIEISNNKVKRKRISNFIPMVTKKLIYTNGLDVDFKYKLKGILLEDGSELPEIEISKEEYNSFKFIIGSQWDKEAIISGNNTTYLREVTQILAKETMQIENVYNHIGFIRIEDKLCYLYHGGSIGDVIGVKADLSVDKLEQYCFTEKQFNVQEALKISFSILDVAPRNITIPLLSTTYLSPLISILQEEGIYADYILYIMGKSGSRKSTLAALILSHWGKNFQRNNFPCSFRDTLNDLEKKAFIIKDSLNNIDDLNPESIGKGKIETFEKTLGMYGDRVGRGRMLQNGKGLRRAYTARGTCIATGEIIPNLPLSRLARCVIINIKKDSIDLDKLIELQNNREQLAYCMMIYIKWIIQNEKWIRDMAKNYMMKLQQTQDNKMHGRTNEAINVMYIGYRFFLQFLQCNQIITIEDNQKLINEAYQILTSISQNQQREIEGSNPINLFYDAIDSLLSNGKICLLDYKTGNPIKENITGKFVGYIDREKGRYYFEPNVIYSEVYKLYSANGEKFPLSALNLWRYLNDEGLLNMTDPSRKTVLRTDAKTGEKVKVIDVKVINTRDIQQEEQ